jgi:hypothetical protein
VPSGFCVMVAPDAPLASLAGWKLIRRLIERLVEQP